ncbi:hypothetical protein [Marinilactibacillus kalidii]|uniref:hypothetical protein n=1 Tax=Marinilactibacillus kalidii TaxID=2820274 RepID=UPI001ABDEE07|nr:hypothetical protein [Marinilactibacillus kalidii]
MLLDLDQPIFIFYLKFFIGHLLSVRLINSNGPYVGFARLSDLGVVSKTSSLNTNAIADQILRGIDSKGN